MNLFRRSPAVPPAPPQPPGPDEWTPEGLLVRVRFANLAGARVLLYARSLNDGPASSEHGIHCLGCTGTWTMTTGPSSYPLDFFDGREKANEHAGQCRALPGPLPGRPDDETAIGILTTRIAGAQRDHEFSLYVSDFTGDRVRLQRTDIWIHEQLAAIADRRPDLLAVTTDTTSSGTTHVYHQVQPRPSTRTRATAAR
ncbi:hypothetical protein ABZW30_39735 [Kitasatospora sp. NPDC004669]|uniref:hypothetical protein n=1 Tax=Kitasatospora sp. NPDC004669 TaxID=3154555 RepID=UPI0033B00175